MGYGGSVEMVERPRVGHHAERERGGSLGGFVAELGVPFLAPTYSVVRRGEAFAQPAGRAQHPRNARRVGVTHAPPSEAGGRAKSWLRSRTRARASSRAADPAGLNW